MTMRGCRRYPTSNVPISSSELPGPACRQHVRDDARRQRREVAREAVPARDLERDDADLQRVAGRLERPFDAPDVQHVDLARAELHCAGDRDRVDDAAVHEVLTADLD